MLGPEAAGTLTLSAALAARFGVPFISATEMVAAAAQDRSKTAGALLH